MIRDVETRVRQANPLEHAEQLQQLYGADASIDLFRAIHSKREGRMPGTTENERATNEKGPVSITSRTRLTARSTKRRGSGERRRRWLIGAAAAAMVPIVGVALLISIEDDGFDSAAALSTADDYFTAYNAGDADGMFALFADDAVFREAFDGFIRPTFDPDRKYGQTSSRADWELTRTWHLAQGSKVGEQQCEVHQETLDVEVIVVCDFTTMDAAVLALGSEPIPSRTAMTIGPDGIRQLVEEFGWPDFSTTGIPFSNWLEATQPDEYELARLPDAGDTRQNMVVRGEARARLAVQWAAYLEENGCGYTQATC